MNNIATTNTAPIKRKRLDDAPFIAALDFAEYRNAATIARHMLRAGTPASLPTITKRMGEYTAYTSAVEALGKAWRLAPANDDETPPTAPTPPAAEVAPPNRKARRAAKVVEVAPANDNAPAVLPVGLHNQCGLELMRTLPDNSVPLVLCDLPYGTTRSKFDPKINVDEWFAEMRRIVTPRGAILAFCAEPFTTDLMNAGRDLWKSHIVWVKQNTTGFAQSHHRMLKAHESVMVFSKGTVIGGRSARNMTFNPQTAEAYVSPNRKAVGTDFLGQPFTTTKAIGEPVNRLRNCPKDVVYYAKDKGIKFPYAKPVALLEMLIRTYTNEGDVVFDPTMGSGSTGVACVAAGRPFIGCENGFRANGDSIFTYAVERIAAASEAGGAA